MPEGLRYQTCDELIDGLLALPEAQRGSLVTRTPGRAELRLGEARVLVLGPTIFRDPVRLAAELDDRKDPYTVLLVGTDADFDPLPDVGLARHFLVDVPTSDARLRTNVPGLLRLCSVQDEAQESFYWMRRYRYELDELLAISRAISSERDIDRLLDLILEKARYITGADAGSVYVMEEVEGAEPRLRFKITHNESVKVDFAEFTVPVSKRSIVGNAVLRKESINIPDLYRLEPDNRWGVTHDATFDRKIGYESHSMLTVPMVNQREDVIGVIQLINKKRDPKARLASHQDFAEAVVPFDGRSEALARSLAAQAGISLDNALLYAEVQKLFAGFVRASVVAIESRDPTTSGHSQRVAELTVGLAEKVDRCDTGPYGIVTFSKEQLQELEYASLLHDFGKVGVREEVLVKAKKLHPGRRDLILQRFDYVRRTVEAEVLRKKLALLARMPAGEAEAALAELDQELQARVAEMGDIQNFVLKVNEPTVLDSSGFERLQDIARRTYSPFSGEPQPLITEDEVIALRVPRGSLTEDERKQIESHVSHTYNFLKLIPWTRTLRDVPRIAWMHHEKLDGKGYPRAAPAADIPVQSRMMAISDIFDALTASDRPYKRAVPTDKALAILGMEVKDGKLDRDLYQIFVEAEVYKRVL
jgi:HD-GYP domain-containing protein (c-di-GMP phosphodiesterase class II)